MLEEAEANRQRNEFEEKKRLEKVENEKKEKRNSEKSLKAIEDAKADANFKSMSMGT